MSSFVEAGVNNDQGDSPSSLDNSSSSSNNNGADGVNLRVLAGGPPSLLVASSIAPPPTHDGRGHNIQIINSSLSQAATTAGTRAPTSNLSTASPMSDSGLAATSSLAARAGIVNHQQQQHQHQQHSAYQDSQIQQMQMHHQYQYRQQHQYPPHQVPVQHHMGLPPHMHMQNPPLAHSDSIPGSSQHGDGELDDDNDNGQNVAPVKLFVGQVPKNMEETDLTCTFQDYGDIKEILVIRDRHTGQHRGCAFVTFYSPADAARVIEALHDKFTFPDGRKPVQIKPASEPSSSSTPTITPEQENKLFVGMTSRNADENSIRELFESYGEIREIYIIRNADGSNKGCAFLKFSENESAVRAIEEMNDKFTMDGATRPLIVKFADTKAQRKARTTTAASRLAASGGGVNPNAVPNPHGGYYLSPGHHVPVYPNYQQGAPQVPPQMGMPPQYTQSPYTGSYPGAPGNPHVPPHNAYMYQPQSYNSPYGYAPPPGSFVQPGQGGSPVTSTTASGEMYENPSRSSLAGRQHQQPVNRLPKPYQQREISGAVNPRPREGPAGANLFIYHLPHDLTDADLATAFNPFGNVISAKVYVDKFTGESKGFGFVSYDSVISAEQAIEQMNGFQIGSKRLKVQHKRIAARPVVSQQQQQAGGDSLLGSIVSQPPDASEMMGSLPTPQQMQPQVLPSHLNVDSLSGDMHNLDVHYADDEE